MVYLENIDDYNLKISQGGSVSQIRPKITLEARKDEIGRTWIENIYSKEAIIISKPVSEVSCDGTIYESADDLVDALNENLGSNVNLNNTPTDISIDANSIDEFNFIGDIIGAFSTTDEDVGDTFTYSLVGGTGSTNNASFTVDGANLKAAEIFNTELKSSYSIRVRSTDAAGGYTEKVFAITINFIDTDFRNQDPIWTSAQVDAKLAELAATNMYDRIIDFRGNEQRTSGSDGAVASLTSAGNQILQTSVNDAFQITVDTTKAGSANDTFILPLRLSALVDYDFHITTTDGHSQDVTGRGDLLGNQTLTFSAPGIYQISITENSASGFPQIYFNAEGDKEKVVSIDNWGSIKWLDMVNAFRGCTIMVANYSDIPDTALVTNFSGMYRDCDAFNGVIDNMDTGAGTNFSTMLWSAGAFKQSLAGFDISSATNLTNMALSCDINETGTTTNYDATLASWRSQAETNNITGLSVSFGSSKYSSAAQADRAFLVLPVLDGGLGWTITDGGLAT